MSKAKKAFRKVIDGVTVQYLERIVVFILPPGMNSVQLREWRRVYHSEVFEWLETLIN